MRKEKTDRYSCNHCDNHTENHRILAAWHRPNKRSLEVRFAQFRQLAKEIALLVAEMCRQLRDQTHVGVAEIAGLAVGHAFAGEAQELVVLGAGRNRHRDVAGDRGDGDLRAEHQLVKVDRQVDVEIVALALVWRLVVNVHDEIEIPILAAAATRATLPGETNALAILHAARNGEIEGAIGDDLPGAAALRADGGVEHAVAAATWAAGRHLERNLFLAAVVRFAKRQLDGSLQIAAALREALPRAASDTGEEHVEEIGKAAASSAARADVEAAVGLGLRLAVTTLLLRLSRGLLPIAAENIVFLALLGIAEDLIGLLDLFEFVLGLLWILQIGIGVPFARELPIRGLDIFFSRVLRNTENLVVVFVVQW